MTMKCAKALVIEVMRWTRRRAREAEYVAGHFRSGVGKGAIVVLKRKARDHQGGWADRWYPNMSRCVGALGVVTRNAGPHGFVVTFFRGKWDQYAYPYFVLQALAPDCPVRVNGKDTTASNAAAEGWKRMKAKRRKKA